MKIELSTSQDDRDAIIRGLVQFNDAHAAPENFKPLTFAVRDQQGQLVGGLNAYISFRWLFITHLWIEEDARGRGLGTQLLKLAEQEAVRRNCIHIHLDTFDFQAAGFYTARGFEVYARLEGCPPGHTRFSMVKHNIDLKGEPS